MTRSGPGLLREASPGSDADRERRRITFDRAAQLYHRARPDYPEDLFDQLIDTSNLQPGAHLLEVTSLPLNTVPARPQTGAFPYANVT